MILLMMLGRACICYMYMYICTYVCTFDSHIHKRHTYVRKSMYSDMDFAFSLYLSLFILPNQFYSNLQYSSFHSYPP